MQVEKIVVFQRRSFTRNGREFTFKKHILLNRMSPGDEIQIEYHALCGYSKRFIGTPFLSKTLRHPKSEMCAKCLKKAKSQRLDSLEKLVMQMERDLSDHKSDLERISRYAERILGEEDKRISSHRVAAKLMKMLKREESEEQK